jgi:hypothetical protein
MERVFGFEILSAPFVIAHLQIAIALEELGAPLANDGERAAVHLTNALTGWEPPKAGKRQLGLVFPEFAEEQQAATEIKKKKRIIVVLGNPPYNAFAGVSTPAEGHLVDVYKEGLAKEWGVKKYNLDEMYVRFFRLAEKRIAELSEFGVVAYISNFSYLSKPSFVVMRSRLLGEFDRFWFDSLNGDSRETGKLTPDGKPDPSVFSTEYNPEGIQPGTAIGIMVRSQKRSDDKKVLFREFWGGTKRQDLLSSLENTQFDSQYQRVTPERSNWFTFRRANAGARYLSWPQVTDLCAEPPLNGLMEKRGGALIKINRGDLERQMRAYFNPQLSWEAYRETGYGLVEGQARFDPEKTRDRALTEEFEDEKIVPYTVRPFDVRWAYYTGTRPIWNEPRPQLWARFGEGNGFILTRPAGVASPEGTPFFFTKLLGDNDFLRGHAYYFPVALGKKSPVPNVSEAVKHYLAELTVSSVETQIWWHVLAIGYSPLYISDNADGIQQEWPRVPMPNSADLLHDSVELGRSVAALLDTEKPVPGITAGAIRPGLAKLAVATPIGEGTLTGRPDELKLNVGWGHYGKNRVIMPGRGRAVARSYSNDELGALAAQSAEDEIGRDALKELLGDQTNDIYLNDRLYLSNVPERVWEYTIGGYKVIKKWLSYREKEILGRALTFDELTELTSTIRRIAAIVLLESKLDANYERIKQATHQWPSTN